MCVRSRLTKSINCVVSGAGYLLFNARSCSPRTTMPGLKPDVSCTLGGRWLGQVRECAQHNEIILLSLVIVLHGGQETEALNPCPDHRPGLDPPDSCALKCICRKIGVPVEPGPSRPPLRPLLDDPWTMNNPCTHGSTGTRSRSPARGLQPQRSPNCLMHHVLQTLHLFSCTKLLSGRVELGNHLLCRGNSAHLPEGISS